jgi:uncharacterized membrane protein YagU involved in acid resistance
MAAISIVLAVIFLILSTISRDGITWMDDVIGFLITLFIITVLLGFVCSLLSLREPSSKQKLLGLAVNIVLFVLLAVSVFQNLDTITSMFS